MTAFCKARVPESISTQLDLVQANEEEVRQAGVDIGTAMCKALLESDVSVPGLHFYTLNLEKVTYGIMQNLGIGFVHFILPSPSVSSLFCLSTLFCLFCLYQTKHFHTFASRTVGLKVADE